MLLLEWSPYIKSVKVARNDWQKKKETFMVAGIIVRDIC